MAHKSAYRPTTSFRTYRTDRKLHFGGRGGYFGGKGLKQVVMNRCQIVSHLKVSIKLGQR